MYYAWAMEEIRSSVGNLDFKPEDLIGKRKLHDLFCAIMIFGNVQNCEIIHLTKPVFAK